MRHRFSVGFCVAVALVAFATFNSAAQAQQGQTAGVMVDAQGVLRTQTFADPNGALTRQRIEASKQALAGKLAVPSDMRKISLTRLEQAISAQLDMGRRLTDEMRYLAGLSRIEYVFCYPESGDIVIAGPAEPWSDDLSGRIRGIQSGRPVIELQDLLVALRTFPAHDGGGDPVIGCSIDPTAEGLSRMQQFLRNIGGRATPNDTQFIVNGLRTSLGLQDVTVLGVSPTTHFAQVMVEADYRMKLIGIGLEQCPVKMQSYVQRANPAQVSRNAMCRWYFTPNYECVRVSDDGLAMQLEGLGVKLIGEDELVGADGQRRVAGGNGNRASSAFVQDFTRKYPQIAERSPVFAQLRNLIDMSIAAAFIQQEDYYGKCDTQLAILNSEEKVPVETFPAPIHVESAVNSLWKGNTLMTPVGGGVNIQPRIALATDHVIEDEAGNVAKQRLELNLKALAQGQWWWD